MKTYKVVYTESLAHIFYVDADNENEARQKFQHQSANGEIDYSGGEVYHTNIESISEVALGEK